MLLTYKKNTFVRLANERSVPSVSVKTSELNPMLTSATTLSVMLFALVHTMLAPRDTCACLSFTLGNPGFPLCWIASHSVFRSKAVNSREESQIGYASSFVAPCVVWGLNVATTSLAGPPLSSNAIVL